MAIAVIKSTPEVVDYPDLFQEYLERALQGNLEAVEHCGNILPDLLRDDALHLLTFGLQIRHVWAIAKELLLVMSPKMEIAGFREEWISYLQQGLVQSDLIQDQRATVELRYQIGYLYRLCSRYDQALHWLTSSLGLAKRFEFHTLAAKSLNQLAYVAWQQHDYDQATEYAQQALQLLSEDHIERAMSLSALGLIAIDRRHWQDAEQLHRQALAIRTQYADRRLMAWSLQNLGYSLRGQAKYEESVSSYHSAILILEELNDIANGAVAQMNLGIVYSMLGKPDQAIVSYIRSEQVFQRLGDRYHLGMNLNSQGIDYMAMQDWVAAEKAFSSSMQCFAELQDMGWQMNAYDGLGLVYLRQGKSEAAIGVFQEILAMLPHITDQSMARYLSNVVPTQIAEAEQKMQPYISKLR